MKGASELETDSGGRTACPNSSRHSWLPLYTPRPNPDRHDSLPPTLAERDVPQGQKSSSQEEGRSPRKRIPPFGRLLMANERKTPVEILQQVSQVAVAWNRGHPWNGGQRLSNKERSRAELQQSEHQHICRGIKPPRAIRRLWWSFPEGRAMSHLARSCTPLRGKSKEILRQRWLRPSPCCPSEGLQEA